MNNILVFLFLFLIFGLGLIAGGCTERKSMRDYQRLQADYNMKLRLRDEGRMALYAR